MNTSQHWRKPLVGLLFLALTLCFGATYAQASTAAGTELTNTVTVNYESLGGVGYSDTASVTVTVSLVKVAPTVAFISQDPVATALDPTDERTVVTQTYSIYSNSNGAVEHTINEATYAANDISAATAVTASTTVWLGATTLAFRASADTDIYVPFDGLDDGEILTGDATAIGEGLAVDDFVMIDGTKYQITAIEEDTNANPGSLPAGLQGRFARLTLDAALTDSPGVLITEYYEFDVSLTTGDIDAGLTEGDYDGELTATDGTNTSVAATSKVYVARANLSVTKEVSTDGGTTWVDTSASALPGTTLQYRITVTNETAKPSTAINITDVLSPYSAFQSTGDPTFTDDLVDPSGLDYTTATISYLDHDGAVYTLTDEGGGAPAGFDADVAQFEIDFGSQNMDGNSSFTLTYSVKIY